MAETITAKLKITMQVESADTAGKSTNAGIASLSRNISFANGTGASQVDTGVTVDQTLTDTTPVNYELDDGSLTGPLGDAQTFAEVQTLVVYNDGAAALTVGGDFLGCTIPVPAGGTLTLDFGTAGRAVGSGQDTLTITPAASGSCEVYITGRSA